MSETQKKSVGSSEQNVAGPDFFSLYAREIADLLSEHEHTLPTSNASELSQGKYRMVNGNEATDKSGKGASLFENSIGAGFSDFKKERLKGLLRQSVNDLTKEIDEMFDPVLKLCELQHELRSNNKRPKMSSSCSSKEGEDDMDFLLKNDYQLNAEALKKYSDEQLSTLLHMEQKLEEILDAIMSKSRPMTRSEKRQLQKLIQKLPQENLVRIVEIIQRGRRAGEPCGEEIFVDLENEDNVTLWRLYYYVEAVEKAKMLAQLQCNVVQPQHFSHPY